MEAVTRYSQATLPTPWGDFTAVVYRARRSVPHQIGSVVPSEDELIALVRGEVRGKSDVPTRVHSECLTGEVFHSLRCDCKAQLELALETIARADLGIFIYLRQEGRGIGLGNKVRAYELQDAGQDTVDANLSLGFSADERSYDWAASVLRDLGPVSVELMTNNPAKIAGLAGCGISVVAQKSHWATASEQSQNYLEVKRVRMGHLPDDTHRKIK